LFGLVLAIGIVVDDAIVVVENTSRNIDQNNLEPKEAAIRAMQEVGGPVVATTLVLLAVFIPTSFMGGMTGVLYPQFALTIATATVFSSINALTLSPALCALVLRRTPERRTWFFRGFNAFFDAVTTGYNRVVKLAVRRAFISALVFIGLTTVALLGFISLPTGFVPEEDQGYLMVNVQLPDGASLQRTKEVMKKVDKIIADTPGVAYNVTISGFSILESMASSNMGANVVVLEPWDKRKGPEKQLPAILGRMRKGFANIQEAIVVAFNTPAIPGLGNAGGFDMQVQDRSGVGLNVLQHVSMELVQDGNAQEGLTGLFTSFRANVPQLFGDVDRDKVKTLGIALDSVFETMQAFLGSAYVNDFNKFGRTYQVNLQADAQFRAQAQDIRRLEVKNQNGEMVPLGTLIDVRESFGPQVITRFNMYPSASLKGSAASGYSSGEALKLMTQMADSKLPSSMGFQWTGLSYQETRAGGEAPFIFAIAVVFVFLVLAAQYESWKIPVPAIMSVPTALLGAVAAVMARSLDNNVYTQIGIVLLIGLSAKSAILIVEFAKDRYESGKSAAEAAVEAASLRFRPILMTAFSFILGVVPLVLATGAGAGSRRALGTAVFGGMLVATILSVVLVPPLFRIFQSLGQGKKRVAPKDQVDSSP
jgi:HAE1 family hydrophobic/amphiphilic exporter-1